MARNESQATQLLEKLRTRTSSGSLRWERSVEPRKYQARMGEFIMQIGPEAGGLALVIRKLSGALIDTFSTSYNALSATVTGTMMTAPLNGSNRMILENIYSMIDDHNDELDELIKLL